MVTNLTNLSNAETFLDIIKFDNEVTGGLMAQLFVLAIFLILLFIMLRTNPFTHSFLVASFSAWVISIMLVAAELLSFIHIITFGILTAFMAFWVKFSDR